MPTDKSFVLNTADYENISFADGDSSKEVATVLGDSGRTQIVIGDEASGQM